MRFGGTNSLEDSAPVAAPTRSVLSAAPAPAINTPAAPAFESNSRRFIAIPLFISATLSRAFRRPYTIYRETARSYRGMQPVGLLSQHPLPGSASAHMPEAPRQRHRATHQPSVAASAL